MNKLVFAAMLMTVCLFISNCGSKVKPAFDTPENTFATLVAAIHAKDLEVYTQCWYPEVAEREGLVAQLKADPTTWDRLDALVKGPQTLTDRKDASENVLTIAAFAVKAPEMERPGLDGISFVKTGNEWRAYHW
jgi:hypothetical protein